MPKAISTIGELKSRLGEEFGVSHWHDVLPDAEVVPAYAALALGPQLADEVLALEGLAVPSHHGLDRVRFPAPLPEGAQVRVRVSLEGMTEHPDGADVTLLLTFECSAHDRPVCVAEMVQRLAATSTGRSPDG